MAHSTHNICHFSNHVPLPYTSIGTTSGWAGAHACKEMCGHWLLASAT